MIKDFLDGLGSNVPEVEVKDDINFGITWFRSYETAENFTSKLSMLMMVRKMPCTKKLTNAFSQPCIKCKLK